MANFFLDNKDIQFHLDHPLMKKIVDLKEQGFRDKGAYDYAPVDFEDAVDSYRKVLEIVGDVAANTIAVNADSVDKEGPRVENESGTTGERGIPAFHVEGDIRTTRLY